VTGDLALVPGTGPADDLTDVLVRLAWYGAPLVDAGARIWLQDTSSVHAALNAPAPFWAGEAAAQRFARLSRSVAFGRPPAGHTRLCWLATHPTYDFFTSAPPRARLWRLDELADASAVVRWVSFGAHALPPVPVWSRPDPVPHTCLLIGPGKTGAELSAHEAAPGTWVMMVLSAWLQRDRATQLRPDAILMTDALSVVGPSRSAEAARDALVRACRDGIILLAPAPLGARLSFLLPPDCAGQIRAAPTLAPVPRGTGATLAHRLAALDPAANNVLTALALPVAATVSRRLVIVGFDGLLGAQQVFAHSDEEARRLRHNNIRMAHPMSGLTDAYAGQAMRAAQRALSLLQADGIELVLPAAGHEQPATATLEPSHRQHRVMAALARGAFGMSGWADAHPLGFSLGIAALAAFLAEGSGHMLSGLEPTVAIALLAGLLVLSASLLVLHLRRRQNRLLAAQNRECAHRIREALALSRSGSVNPQLVPDTPAGTAGADPAT
jgi:hypothetical protein